MSETIKLCAMLVRHVFAPDDEARDEEMRRPFVEQAMRAKREHDEMRRELAEARAELARCADAAAGFFQEGDTVSDTVQVVADALGHAKAAERGLKAERDEARRLLGRIGDWTHQYGAALCPTAGSADSFGDGMREAKRQVATIVAAHLGRSE